MQILFLITLTDINLLLAIKISWWQSDVWYLAYMTPIVHSLEQAQFLHPSVNSPILVFTSTRFWKTAGGIVLGSVAVSTISAVPAVSADVLPYISVAIKASFLKLGMCNICKHNIAKMFLDFFVNLKLFIWQRFLKFLVKNLLRAESQKPLGGFSQTLHCRYI